MGVFLLSIIECIGGKHLRFKEKKLHFLLLFFWHTHSFALFQIALLPLPDGSIKLWVAKTQVILFIHERHFNE